MFSFIFKVILITLLACGAITSVIVYFAKSQDNVHLLSTSSNSEEIRSVISTFFASACHWFVTVISKLTVSQGA